MLHALVLSPQVWPCRDCGPNPNMANTRKLYIHACPGITRVPFPPSLYPGSPTNFPTTFVLPEVFFPSAVNRGGQVGFIKGRVPPRRAPGQRTKKGMPLGTHKTCHECYVLRTDMGALWGSLPLAGRSLDMWLQCGMTWSPVKYQLNPTEGNLGLSLLSYTLTKGFSTVYQRLSAQCDKA